MKTYKIGEVAKIFNTTTRTIRYYDEINLLSPYQKDKNSGYRLYNDVNLKELSTIFFLKSLDFSLKEMEEYKNTEDKAKLFLKHKRELKRKEELINKVVNNTINLTSYYLQTKHYTDRPSAKLEGVWQLEGIYKNMKDAYSSISKIDKLTPYKFLAFDNEGHSPWFYTAYSKTIDFSTNYLPFSERYIKKDNVLYLEIKNFKEHLFMPAEIEKQINSPHILKFTKFSDNYEDYKMFLFEDDLEKIKAEQKILENGCYKLVGYSFNENLENMFLSNKKSYLIIEDDQVLQMPNNSFKMKLCGNYLIEDNLKLKMKISKIGDYFLVENKTRIYTFTGKKGYNIYKKFS